MVQGIFWKWVFKKIWGLIKDANDDRMAKSHHKRIKALEKTSHPQADWICLECGCKAKKKETPTKRRRRKRLINKEK